jgi:arylsulfatase
MADKTIEWLHGIRAQDARKPFFVYYSTGCSHAPHHVAPEWADKYKGKFDQGWDRLREEVIARQQHLGVIPADAKLTPRDDAFPAWDEVPDKLKSYYARQMEVYAGYSENADHNVGRVIDAIAELGGLTTLWSSGSGGTTAPAWGHGYRLVQRDDDAERHPLTDDMQVQLAERYGGIDAWGTQLMDPHYSAAWAWAGNTPFKWGKQVARTSAGRATRWSSTGSADHRPRRCARISPTPSTSADDPGIAGSLPPPRRRDRAEPLHGVTFADSLADAGAPERHPTVLRDHRHRAMYKDGWWLAMRTPRIRGC